MLIDDLMPRYDAVRTEHRVVAAPRDRVYDAVRETDFVATVAASPAVRVLFGARALGERVVSAVRGRASAEPAPVESMRLADMGTHGEWVLLGEDPPHEIAFGAVGRFWAGETAWERIDAADFGTLDRPGLAKIACNFSLREYGGDRSLVSYECRTLATDEQSRRAFLRYWRLLSPFIGVVLRAQLAMVACEAVGKVTARRRVLS
jgi:hypothetical protein